MSLSNTREEDVDDLDDIVDQFDTKPTTDSQQPIPEASSSKSPIQNVPSPSPSSSKPIPGSSTSDPSSALGLDNDALSQLPDDLAKQLAEGMESLMRELADTSNGPLTEEDRKRQENWEKMLVDGMNDIGLDELLGDRNLRDKSDVSKSKSANEPSASTSKPNINDSTPSSSSTQKESVDDFQARIRQAMEKLKDSDSTLHTDASSSAAASDDPLEAILSQISSGLEGSGSGEEDSGLQEMLETMMQQLMSKEVLYEPLKELHDKFPAYLSENAQTLSQEDKTRFTNQLTRVSAIVQIFEDPSYKDDDQEKGAQIVSLMNEMQSFGSPPSEIMGPLPPGFDFGTDGAPKLPDGCTIM